jgi:hypothetical protein
MMVRSPRIPLDLAATTSDIKARVRRVIGELEGIEQQQDPIFASPRDVLLDLVLATHELEAAVMKMRKAWWAPVLLLAIVLMATPSLAVVPHRIPPFSGRTSSIPSVRQSKRLSTHNETTFCCSRHRAPRYAPGIGYRGWCAVLCPQNAPFAGCSTYGRQSDEPGLAFQRPCHPENSRRAGSPHGIMDSSHIHFEGGGTDPVAGAWLGGGNIASSFSCTSLASDARSLHRALKALNLFRLWVGGAQWFLKSGKDHPLDAIGYVAGAVVFAGAGALRLAGVIG